MQSAKAGMTQRERQTEIHHTPNQRELMTYCETGRKDVKIKTKNI